MHFGGCSFLLLPDLLINENAVALSEGPVSLLCNPLCMSGLYIIHFIEHFSSCWVGSNEPKCIEKNLRLILSCCTRLPIPDVN